MQLMRTRRFAMSWRITSTVRRTRSAAAPLDTTALLKATGAEDGTDADQRIVKARMRDVAAELPPLLERIRTAGRAVDDVDVRGPSLQSVFIHLTGRELRE